MKKKGTRAERELLHLFFENNWACARIAGSGSTPMPAPDLLAGGNGRILALECKAGKDNRYLTNKEIKELNEFSSCFGAEAWIGAKFDNVGWFFLKIGDLKISKGGNYFVNIDIAKKKGLKFNELIGEFKQERLK